MSADLQKLYPRFIKEQSESPFHFEKREKPDAMIRAYNPVCGDRFDWFVETEKDSKLFYFHGFGCAISKASASVLAKTLSGKSGREALALCNTFLDYIDSHNEEHALNLTDDFRAFAGVKDFPERYDCVTLSWKEMKKYLESQLKTQ